MEAVAALVKADRPTWGGTATELAAALQTDMKPNAMAMRLNVRAGRLAAEYKTSKTRGRFFCLGTFLNI